MLFFLAYSLQAHADWTITLHVSGMTWAAQCPLRVTQALEKVPDVIEAQTIYKEKKSIVQAQGKGCDPEGEERLIQAIEAIGYKAELLERKEK